MRLYRPQLSALAILLCFVTSSVVARVISNEGGGPEIWKFALHSPSDIPQGDNQLPFEEKEKELEDKSDTGTHSDNAFCNHVVICDFTYAFRFAEQISQTVSLFDGAPVKSALSFPPIFIMDGSLVV